MPALTLSAIRQPAFVFGPDGRIVEANDLAEALAGRPLGGRTDADIIAILAVRTAEGGSIPSTRTPVARALGGEESLDIPLVITATDGRILHVLATTSPIRGEDQIAGALVIWKDVSALVTAGGQLQEQQEELRQQGSDLVRAISELDLQRRLLDTILSTLPHRVSLWDRDHRLVWANERFAAERGLSREAAIGRSAGELGFDPTVTGPLAEEVVQSTSAGRSATHEIEVPGPLGTPWLSVTSVPIFGDSVLVIAEDVTERKRAEEALRESEVRYRRIVEDDITGHVIASPEGRILDCNQAFARIFGFASIEEAKSSSMVETYGSPGEREARLARLRGERRIENEESWRLRRDGTRIHVAENIIGDFDDAGNLVQIRGYISDDTERFRAQEELRESERRHAFLLALGDRIRELSDVTEIMAVASELVGRHLGASGVVYCEVDPAHEHATVRAGWNDGTVSNLKGRFRMDDFGIGDLYRRGLVRRTEDVTAEHDEDEAAAHCALRIRASLGVPICRGGRLAAVLAVHSARPRAWTDEEVELVRQAGDRIFASAERARAEAALRLSEERLRLAQEGAGFGIWDRDAVTDRVTITPGFLRPYGLDEAAISSYEDLVPLIHPEDREQVEAGRQAAFATGGPLNLEFRVVPPSGEARWVQFRGQGVPDAKGALSRVIGVLIDVTDQKRAEATLREREQTMESIFRAAPIGIGMVTHRTITQANEQLCRMTGYTREELIGQDARLFYPSDEAYDYVGREKYAQIAESGTGAVETQWRTKDGTHLDILISSSPVDLSRPYEDVVFNALDITRLRESERALESYMDDLQRSNEELQRFAYVASHDLQEPLRSIISFSQLLERRYKGKLDQDADEFIQFIVEGGNRMQQLIMDLLQLSRVETKAKPLVPTDAGEVAADAIRLMETPIREAGATVTVEDLPTVMADAAQLAQVFTNLIGNALKYRRPDVPPEVRISAERRGKFWRFAVRDNGIGIEAEYFERIFVIFQRLHTREEYEGTGIGLAVVRRIVERHGGRIGVESTPGEGSTFFFTLPAA